MSIFRRSTLRLAIAATAGIIATAASATTPLPQYPNRGKENTVTTSFTAARTGNITAWFTGSTAGYTESLGLMVNGVKTGVTGLNNKTSKLGDSLVLGSAKKGDKLVFFTDVQNTRKTFYSDKSLNGDGINHVFSADYAGDALTPAGIYVAFEDLWGGGDFNYFDETFVFSNVASSVSNSVGGVPEPANWAMLIAGFGLTGGVMRRRRTASFA